MADSSTKSKKKNIPEAIEPSKNAVKVLGQNDQDNAKKDG